MKKLILFASLLSLSLSACGDDEQSLVLLDVKGNAPFKSVNLKLTTTAGERSFKGSTFDAVNALSIGLYLPASLEGSVEITGEAMEDGCLIGTGAVTATDVKKGQMTEPVTLLMTKRPCMPAPDGGGRLDGGRLDGGASDGSVGVGADGAAGDAGGGQTDVPVVGVDAAVDGPVVRTDASMPGPDAPAGVDACVPSNTVCTGRCGTIPNGCGGKIECAGCSYTGQSCNSAGMCVCRTDETAAEVCARNNNPKCGTYLSHCGTAVSCGLCLKTQRCYKGTCQLCDPVVAPASTEAERVAPPLCLDVL